MCATGVGSKSSTSNGGTSSTAEQMDEDAFDTNEEILAGSGIDRSAGGRKRKASEVDGDLIDGNTKDSDDGVGKHNFECRIQ